MSKLFLVNIDMNGNEIQNVVIQPLATAPANPTIGRIYYDTTDHVLKTYDGTNWSAVGAVLSVNNKTGVVTITKSDVGLGNVDNTSDATKKTNFTGSIADGDTGFVTGDAIYDALALKLDANKVGAANGVASLDSNGKISESQIPVSFDEIIFARYNNGNFYADDLATPLLTPRYNVLYVDYYDDGMDGYAGSKKLYAWNGSSYVELSATLALGETSTTAYRGDRGKTAYNHSQLTSGNPHNVTKSDVGLGNVDNKSEATIKSDFTGSIADGNTGFVTGDDAYDALANKQAKITASGILKGNGSGGVTAAVAGTDYGTYSKPSGGIPSSDLASAVQTSLTAADNALPKSGGTMSGVINMGGNKITNVADGTAYSDVATCKQIPAWSHTVPAMDGTASAGSEGAWAKGDHVHPTDTSRMAANLKGAANGVAELDENGKVPSSQLPSYVDDVIEGYYYNSKFYKESSHTTEITGETGKIYVDLSTEKTYRWSGTAFVEISASLALGETSSTAYRGDRGKTAFDHSQLTSGNPHNVSKSDVGLGNVDNKSEATIKSDFTGSITSGDTGFVTGGDVHDLTKPILLNSLSIGTSVNGETTFTATSPVSSQDIYSVMSSSGSKNPKIRFTFTQGNISSAEYVILTITDVKWVHSGTDKYYIDASGIRSDGSIIRMKLTDTSVSGTIESRPNRVLVSTGTIDTSSTSVDVSFTGTFLSAHATVSGDFVITDISISGTTATFSVAAAPSAAITCTVVSMN